MKRKDVKHGQRNLFPVLSIVLIFFACSALLVIILYLLIPVIKDELWILPEASVNALILSCVTLSITLSIVVPWMISKNLVHGIAEEAVKKYYDKGFKQEIQKTHDALYRAYANDSRMIAFFLCESNKPIWALGWVCKSSTSYDSVKDNNQRGIYTTLSVSNILVLIECVTQILGKINAGTPFIEILNADNDERTNDVAIRTTRDLMKFCSTKELRDRDYDDYFENNRGKDIPETLNAALKNLLFCLVKHLKDSHRESEPLLSDLLELENPDDENSLTHQNYYEFIEKQCKKASFETLLSRFVRSANSLKVMYSNYQLDRFIVE